MIVQVGASSDGTHMKRVPADSLAHLIVDHTRSARDTQSPYAYSSIKVDLLDGEKKIQSDGVVAAAGAEAVSRLRCRRAEEIWRKCAAASGSVGDGTEYIILTDRPAARIR